MDLFGSLFDRTMLLASRFERSGKYFNEGVGDLSILESLEEKLKTEGGIDAFEDIELEKVPDKVSAKQDEPHSTQKLYTKTRAEYQSPVAEFFPDEENCKTGYVEIITPKEIKKVKGVVLCVSYTGDQGFSFRRKNIAIPLAKKGYISISPLPPFMGKRRPKTQVDSYIRTLAELVISFHIQVIENAKILKWIREEYPGLNVGITGTSQGACMASMASLMDNEPLALISYLGGFSAEGMCVFEAKMDLNKVDMNVKEMRSFLDKYNVQYCHDHFALRVRESDDKLISRHIFANGDKFISPRQRNRILSFFNELTSDSPIVDEVKVKGGHLSCIMRSSKFLVPNIIETMEKLSEIKESEDKHFQDQYQRLKNFDMIDLTFSGPKVDLTFSDSPYI